MVELNLTLKKDIFEALLNQTSNEIPIKKSPWWKKRLMDLDTGKFKWFDVAVVSSGSPDKYRYEIDHIESRGDKFVVVVVFNKQEDTIQTVQDDFEPGDSDSDFDVEDVQDYVHNDEVIEPEVIEPQIVNPVTINPEFITPEVIDTEHKTDVRELVLKVFDKFCKIPDVYVVNLPHVIIRNNGMIMGCNRRLLADRDSDVRIDFKKVEIVQNIGMSDEVFLGEVIAYLSKSLKNSYVFVNKKYSGFATSDFGELIFKLAIIPKKKYLFLRK